MNSTEGLVTNYGEGGLQNGRGACELLPLRKGGGMEKVVAMLKEGHKKFCVSLKFSHIEVGGAQKVFTLSKKGGGGGSKKSFPLFLVGGGGGHKKSFGSTIAPFCSPPPHN